MMTGAMLYGRSGRRVAAFFSLALFAGLFAGLGGATASLQAQSTAASVPPPDAGTPPAAPLPDTASEAPGDVAAANQAATPPGVSQATQPIHPQTAQPVTQPIGQQPVAPGVESASDAAATNAPVERQIYTPNQVQGSQAAPQAPIDALLVRVPPATTLNSNAGSVEYGDRHRGPFTLQLETTGIYTSNLYNDLGSSSGQRKGAYFQVAVPVGYQHAGHESAYNVYFRGTLANYPGNASLNHTSQIVSGEYVRHTSERTTWDFSAAGGRIQTVEGYLPAVVAVGSTGVLQANFSGGLKPLYNAAATFAMTHRLTERDTVIASATGGFMQQPFSEQTATTAAVLYRNQTGGLDLQWLRSVSPRRAYGLELTNVYVRSLSPVGHSNFTSIQGTYQQALRRAWSLRLSGGPLYSQGEGPGIPTQTTFSYTASGTLDYQTSYAHIAGGYRRVLQLGYLAAASPASEFFLVFDRPLTRTLNFTFDSRYVQDTNADANHGGTGGYSSYGMSTRVNQQITPSLVFFLGGQFFSQSQIGSSVGRNEALFGLNYTFGNVLARTEGR